MSQTPTEVVRVMEQRDEVAEAKVSNNGRFVIATVEKTANINEFNRVLPGEWEVTNVSVITSDKKEADLHIFHKP